MHPTPWRVSDKHGPCIVDASERVVADLSSESGLTLAGSLRYLVDAVNSLAAAEGPAEDEKWEEAKKAIQRSALSYQLPDRIAVDGMGYGWRVWDDQEHWSMVPTNPDNSPVPEPVTWFVPEDARPEVRNVHFNPAPPYEILPGLCERQAAEGFALLRVVPFTEWEAVAVFERKP